MVMQQTHMAQMLLGRIPHPGTGQTQTDLEGAQLFIDQLEMLEVKTRGNLDADEARMLQQSLMSLRLAFVEAVEHPSPSAPPTQPGPASESPTASEPAASATPPEDDGRKRFSKKY